MKTRVIKFRVWDTKFNKMRYNPQIADASFINDAFTDKRFIFMQYTGFDDVDGVEIWEHDLIRTKNNKLAKVVYADGSFMLDFAEEGRYNDYLEYGFEMGVKVEGNIYGAK